MRSSTVILTSLVCIVLGSFIALIFVGYAVYSRLAAIPARESAEINRYQIVAVSNKDFSKAFKIDTQTGKVWVYDEEKFDFLTVKYLHEHGFGSTTQEDLDKLRQEGYAFGLPAHWEEVPELEAVQGKMELRPFSQPRPSGR
jgi:hypothetical protein